MSLDQGPVLLAGDAVVHWQWLASTDVERVAADGNRAAEVRNQLQRLLQVQPEVVLFPGHDTSRLPRHRPDIVVHQPENFSPQAFGLASAPVAVR